MNLKQTLAQLEALGNEKRRAHNAKNGAGDNQFGARLGDLRVLAKQIKTNHELALELWETENLDARLLATLLVKPKSLSASEMKQAPPVAQWTMNCCLVEIGIHSPELRKRALSIGESLGVYRDYPVSKGCTSPFAPIWINELVSRQ